MKYLNYGHPTMGNKLSFKTMLQNGRNFLKQFTSL